MSRTQIMHSVVPIRQRRATECWAAAVAMARGTIQRHPATIQVVKDLAREARVNTEADGTLRLYDGVNVSRLAAAVGLTYRRVRETPVTLALMARWLPRGRLAILGALNNPFRATVTNHAITIFGLVGDGTGQGTTISFVDPYDGQRISHPWDWFEENILVDPHFVLSH